MGDLQQVVERIRQFRDARDWQQFHHPKDMAAGLAIEAAELMELFLWKSEQEQAEIVETKREQIEDELADIGMFLLELADNLNVDLLTAIEAKIEKNAEKYPVEKSKGRNAKYTEL
ncbi:MAG: nucleotide pyrophosphohydrolase [Planctomycetota bacterium]|nr:nucleotide pyrophosphohydrolase [Planctomycetota bacterium]